MRDLSNALEKLSITISIWVPTSYFPRRLWIVVTTCVSQEYPDLKPWFRDVRILLFSRWSEIFYRLCVLIHIWTKGDVVGPLNRLKSSSKIFLPTVPRRCFFCGSFMLFLSCFCYAFMHVCLLMPCGHLLEKGWPLGSRLWCLIVTLSISHWYPGSGVVLDCIDSWSLPSFLLPVVCRMLGIRLVL